MMTSGLVHPHARGDNVLGGLGLDLLSGSPPRAWGQLSAHGIAIRSHPVHPHARGDNIIPPALAKEKFGSPPRAWGQWVVCQHLRWDRRFTPTRVGTMTHW